MAEKGATMTVNQLINVLENITIGNEHILDYEIHLIGGKCDYDTIKEISTNDTNFWPIEKYVEVKIFDIKQNGILYLEAKY